jgi:hypothetical protein
VHASHNACMYFLKVLSLLHTCRPHAGADPAVGTSRGGVTGPGIACVSTYEHNALGAGLICVISLGVAIGCMLPNRMASLQKLSRRPATILCPKPQGGGGRAGAANRLISQYEALRLAVPLPVNKVAQVRILGGVIEAWLGPPCARDL